MQCIHTASFTSFLIGVASGKPPHFFYKHIYSLCILPKRVVTRASSVHKRIKNPAFDIAAKRYKKHKNKISELVISVVYNE